MRSFVSLNGKKSCLTSIRKGEKSPFVQVGYLAKLNQGRSKLITFSLITFTVLFPSFVPSSLLDRANGSPLGGSLNTEIQMKAALTSASSLNVLPSNLVVELSAVGSDYVGSNINRGCEVGALDANPIQHRPSDAICSFGDTRSRTTLVLFGDSQANMWLPTFDAMGKQDHVKIVLYSREACQMASVDTWNNFSLDGSKGCSAFRRWALARIAILKPTYIVLAFYQDDDHVSFDHRVISRSQYGSSLAVTLHALRLASKNVLFMGKIPFPTTDPKICASVNPNALRQCGVHRRLALSAATEAQMKSVSSLEHSSYIDLMHFVCTSSFCPVVINNTIAYTDQWHLARHYMAEIQNLAITEIHFLGIR